MGYGPLFTKLVTPPVPVTEDKNYQGVMFNAIFQHLNEMKQHMAGQSGRGFGEFYTAVINFANNASSGETGNSGQAKTIKAKEEELKELKEKERLKEFAEWKEKGWYAEEAETGELNAVAKGKGKGKGKGPCWTCNGPHMQRDCPQGGKACYNCGA